MLVKLTTDDNLDSRLLFLLPHRLDDLDGIRDHQKVVEKRLGCDRLSSEFTSLFSHMSKFLSFFYKSKFITQSKKSM